MQNNLLQPLFKNQLIQNSLLMQNSLLRPHFQNQLIQNNLLKKLLIREILGSCEYFM